MGYLFKNHKLYTLQGSTMTSNSAKRRQRIKEQSKVVANYLNITPPPELVEEWWDDIQGASYEFDAVATQIARWGADQELEACCADVQMGLGPNEADWLRSARRPEPLSLKKVAYDALDTYIYGNPDPKDKERTYNAIRHALEQLHD